MPNIFFCEHENVVEESMSGLWLVAFYIVNAHENVVEESMRKDASRDTCGYRQKKVVKTYFFGPIENEIQIIS